MKKHNEGYALVLVLVVMVVLSIAATGLMSIGLSNLKAQKAVGDRMVAKYAAQGEIEKVIALLSQPVEKEITINSESSEEDAKEALENRLKTYVSDWVQEQCGKVPEDIAVAEDGTSWKYTCTLSMNAAKDGTSIEYTLQLGGTVLEETNEYGKTVCEIKPLEPTYRSYVISHNLEGGGS